MEQILIKLLNGDKIVRLGEYSWRWAKRSPGNPSLKNATTSSMFRRDLVEEINGEMKLTQSGTIIAEDFKRKQK